MQRIWSAGLDSRTDSTNIPCAIRTTAGSPLIPLWPPTWIVGNILLKYASHMDCLDRPVSKRKPLFVVRLSLQFSYRVVCPCVVLIPKPSIFLSDTPAPLKAGTRL